MVESGLYSTKITYLCLYITSKQRYVMKKYTKTLSQQQKDELINVLKSRFEKNMLRHPNVIWEHVQTRLEANVEKLWSLNEMEQSGGEPDIIDFDKKTGEYLFVDCSPETPKGRTNLCYDQEALISRKENKPANSAMDMATAMGIEILTEQAYRKLQEVGNFDTKTSSWLQTPSEIRKLGGALFADFRYGHTFVYHNGASSYYAVRGFRGMLNV